MSNPSPEFTKKAQQLINIVLYGESMPNNMQDSVIVDNDWLRHVVKATKELADMISPTERVIREITMERKRQVEKLSYLPEDDDNQSRGELAQAACYMAFPGDPSGLGLFPRDWSLETHSYRRGKTTRERLVVAAALLVAEIERIDRLV
jgi:hypothetical protein